MSAPLEGLKVVELARILAGPWIGQTLADLGADVLKVEAPAGDDTRRWGPPFVEREGDRSAAYYYATNRGKRLMVCDFADAGQLAALKAEIAEADVVVENFKVGGLRRFGLDYESLAATNPRLVYASITGFGQTGPKAHLPGYDLLIQGACGIMDLTGEAEGDPQKVGVAWVDILTGLYGVIGIQSALAERARSGIGQHVDLALMDCAVAAMANQAMNFLVTGRAPRRMGNEHPNIAPYQVFPASDGHVIIACGNDRQFQALCAHLDLPDLAADPRYATNPDRVAHRETLIPMLAAATRRFDRGALVALLEAAGVPGGPINTVGDAVVDPQVAARGLVVHPEGIAGLRTPLSFSRSHLTLARSAPPLTTKGGD
ncbi:CaiB/BaiF CoA transferase family protein [Roseitranquillus sediminis]|uniref:CaiB/BaiF CoA transferase family protein n=1 Tax=Roseitranquillus sediminis TaxID=2809051 RepID=UPI001D0C0946|nr:CaiB/BaiF CoA-transferase family protein [Roseitranquillus sediminis]MBM9594931.1 CoA transferase [Roseitranquillus sediminis]